MTQYMRLSDAARILQVSEGTIRSYIRKGKFDARKVTYPERAGMRGDHEGWVVSLDSVENMKDRVGKWRKPTVPYEDHEAIARDYIETDATYQSIGDRYGVTRERIRQLVALVDEDAPKKKRARNLAEKERREDEAQTRLLLENMAYAIEHDLHCYTCGAWVLRAVKVKDYYVCCSDECTEAMYLLRHFDEYEAHRMMQAKSIMKRVEEGADMTPSRVEWAKRMFSDNPPPANRRYFQPGSERVQVIMKYRLEEFKEVVRSCKPGTRTYEAFKHVLSDTEEDQVPD